MQPQLPQPQLHGASAAQGEIVDHHHPGDKLGKGGGDGCAGNAQIQGIDGDGIQDDIQQTACDGADHHPPGAAIHPDKQTEAVGNGVERRACQHNPQIGEGIGHDLFPCAEQPQQPFREQISHQDQHRTEQDHQQETVVEDILGFFALSLPQPQGQQGRSAGPHQNGKGVNKPHNRVSHSGGSDADLPHEVAHKYLIDDIVQGADEHHGDGGQGILQDQLEDPFCAQGFRPLSGLILFHGRGSFRLVW